MARQYTKLADIQYVASSAGSVYSNPAATKSYISSIILFNNNSTSETVQLYNVPDSGGSVGTASNANKFLEVLLTTKETLIVDFPYPITITDTNDSIQAVTTTGSQVTIQILGDVDA